MEFCNYRGGTPRFAEERGHRCAEAASDAFLNLSERRRDLRSLLRRRMIPVLPPRKMNFYSRAGFVFLLESEAKEEASKLIDEQAILAIAKERAEGIVDRAKNDSVKMRNVTVNYIEGIVNDTYKSLERALNAVEQLKETYTNEDKEER